MSGCVCGVLVTSYLLSAPPPGLDDANSQVTSQEEELKKLKQTLEIEKMKKAEAINKLTVVSETITFPSSLVPRPFVSGVSVPDHLPWVSFPDPLSSHRREGSFPDPLSSQRREVWE